MDTANVDVWSEVTRLRREFAEQVAGLEPGQWDLPSWCSGWRIRDVLGHLVYFAEATRTGLIRHIVAAGGRPDRAIDKQARKLGNQPVPELVERLRSKADGGFHIVGTPAAAPLGDLLVHGADAFRPVGVALEPPLADCLVVLDAYKTWGRRVFHAVPHRGVSLVATDADWCSGDGPEVRGNAIDLVLLMANRRQVVDRLHGDGVTHLTF